VCSTKRFPGYDNESNQYNAQLHRDYIYGKHVANYMDHLSNEDESMFQKQFSRFIKLGLNSGNVSTVFFYL
jgi:large subunit ribosomal protein L5e